MSNDKDGFPFDEFTEEFCKFGFRQCIQLAGASSRTRMVHFSKRPGQWRCVGVDRRTSAFLFPLLRFDILGKGLNNVMYMGVLAA